MQASNSLANLCPLAWPPSPNAHLNFSCFFLIFLKPLIKVSHVLDERNQVTLFLLFES